MVIASRLASDGIRGRLIRVLVFFALAIMPANVPISEILPEGPHAIVQDTDGPDPDIDELVASLASGSWE